MKIFVIAILVLVTHSISEAAVYKCKVDGKTVYQQSPCKSEGREMNIKSRATDRPYHKLPDLEFKRLPLGGVNNAPIDSAKSALRGLMKDPSSVKFENMRALRVSHAGGQEIIVCGDYNAKNSYGGYVGLKPFFFRDRKVYIDKNYLFVPVQIKNTKYNFNKVSIDCAIHGEDIE